MISFYAFATIVGLGLLALGVFGSGEADEVDLPDLDGEVNADGDGAWKKFFSLRALAYFAAGFGTTGLLLTLLGTEGLVTLLLALGMGALASAFVVILFGWIRATEGGFAEGSDAYIGAVGRVTVPIRPPTPGSVDIEHGGRVHSMRALAHGDPGADPAAWTEVVVVDVDPGRGILLVQPLDELLTDGGGAASSPLRP